MIRILTALIVCFATTVGCNKSNNAEVTQAKADAEAAKVKAEAEAAKAKEEALATKAELAKAKERADAAEGELDKLKAAQAKPKPVDDDRRAAEWVLRVGGVVRVSTEGVASEHPKEGKLPDGPLKVTFVNLTEPSHQNKLTNEGIKYLTGLKHLKSLNLDNCQGVDDFTFLKGMDSLESFHASSTDAGLVQLKELTGIKVLAIGGFFGNPKITDAGLEHLKELRNLERLDISGVKITNAGLEHLSSLNKLQWLSLFRTPISDAGLQHLKGLTELRELHMSSTQVTGTGVGHLKGMPKLEVLHLQTSKVTDAGLEHFKVLSNLRSLNVYDTKVTEDGIKALKSALPNCNITSNVKK